LGRPDLRAKRGVFAAAGYDHIDFRVRDVRALAPFYDTLMPALGFSRIVRGQRGRTYYQAERHLPFFWLAQAKAGAPNRSRIAFAAATRKDVDRVAAVARRAGARKLEGPQVCRSYSQPYYAVFFEDRDGNKFEVCCRR
jgi:catechol 2,3-dioxygenase-like lactoylglutathione lyase family enzyme